MSLYIPLSLFYNTSKFIEYANQGGEMKKNSIALLTMTLLVITFHCKKEAPLKGLSLEVTFSEPNLSDNLITDIQYRWKTSGEFMKLSQDYKVFVQFWHKDNLILSDDHMPEPSTSQWEPNKEYSYSRKIYIPQFIDEFDPEFKGEELVKLSIGFTSPFDKTGKPVVQVLEQKLRVSPPPLDTPEIIYEDGWYNLEIDPQAYLKQWRWTMKEAKCIIDNPKKDALLVIKGGVNLEALDEQKIIFKINDMILDEFIPEESYFEKSYNIKKEMLGEDEEFILYISTDKTFIPAKVIPNSKDERELGVQISFIYFR